MVVSLGPGKFYGSSLPRPRFYTDVKFNSDRVDPPLPVLDPLLSWASEAHWSMGGLSFNRLRLQGRIEGSVKRLRAQQIKKQAKSVSPAGKGYAGKKRDMDSPSPPPAPIANKRRRRYMAEVDEEDSESEEEEKVMVDDDSDEDESSDEEEEPIPVPIVNKKKPARKLYEEFNQVSDKRRPEGGEKIPDLNRETSDDAEDEASPKKRKQMRPGSGLVAGTRTSPRTRSSSRRLVKRGLD